MKPVPFSKVWGDDVPREPAPVRKSDESQMSTMKKKERNVSVDPDEETIFDGYYNPSATFDFTTDVILIGI